MFQTASTAASASDTAGGSSGAAGKSTATAGLPPGSGCAPGVPVPAGVPAGLVACVELTVADGHGWTFVLQPDFAFRIIATPPGQEAKTANPPIKANNSNPKLAAAWQVLADKMMREHPAPAPVPVDGAPATGGATNDNAAPAEAGGLLDGLLGGLSAAGGAVTGFVDGIVGGITDGVGGLLEAVWPSAPAPATETPAATPAPEAPAGDTPAPAPAPATGGTPQFLNQRDNTFDKDGVDGENMCTVTSLAMQLLGLLGSADAVKQATAALITGKGGTAPAGDALASAQPEDVLMTFFDTLASQGYWATKAKETKAPFYGNWINDVPCGTKYHQSGVCQAHVLAMFSGITADNQSRGNAGCATVEKFLTEHIKPQLDKGVSFAMSTKLTGGHFVALVAVLADGIIVHDPYGARHDATHLRNGTSSEGLDETAKANLAVRFRENPTLAGALAGPPCELPSWGERNYFTWPQVETWKIGEFVTSAAKA